MPIALHRAKYVFAHPNLLLENAAVRVSDIGNILQVESWQKCQEDSAAAVTDWGSAIILPGLINAHAHLELTALHGQLTEFDTFTEWILKLIKLRQAWSGREYQASARKGARLALASGTTLVADITASGFGWNAIEGEILRRVVFEEILTLSPNRVDSVLAQLNTLLDRADAQPLQVHGVSPHAPYSVCPELYRRAADLARIRNIRLTTHIAETPAELQFLQTADGEFRDFLKTIGALPDDWKPPAAPPIAFLDSLGVLGPSCLLAHCNYLDGESVQRIAKSRSSVVYCPRSHGFFGHAHHPIRQLLDAGIGVALGTDSLASNDSLSMIDEMRYLFTSRKDVGAEEIFQAATANGACALGYGDRLGCLKPGYLADMAILELPHSLGSRQLLPQILEGAGECIATIVQGGIAWQKPSCPSPTGNR